MSCSSYSGCFCEKREVEEGKKHDVEFFESGEDPAESIERSKQQLDFVAFLIPSAIMFPGGEAVGFFAETTRIMTRSRTS